MSQSVENSGGDGESENVTKLVQKKGAHSTVWNFFGFKPEDDAQTVIICKQCFGIVAAPQGNTTNLYNHLKRHHKIQYELAMKDKGATTQSTSRQTTQTSITQTLYGASPYPSSSQRHKEITNAIAYHLAKDMAPINTVQNEGFKAMMKTLDKRYCLPSRNYFSSVALPDLYTRCRTTVEEELQNIHYFAATTDLWSSRTMEPYLSLTVHFITRDFKLKSRCLQTVFFPADHTGEELAQGLKESLNSWSLEEQKMVCITTDSGANIVKATSLNNWTRLQCFGHRLHLAIENAMKDSRIERAVGLCKKIVAYFSHSWKRKRELAIAQKELNLPEHQLKTECPTRWGSRQAMVQRVLEQQTAIGHVLSSDRKARHLTPTWQDIEVLEVINKTLTPLADFTDALSGEQYVTSSSVKPVLHLFETMMAVQEDDTDLARSIKSKILHYLQEKYSDPHTQELLNLATALDPRFKLDYVSEDNKVSVKDRLKNEMTSIGMQSPPTTVPSTQPSLLPVEKKRKTLGSFFKAAKGNEAAASSSDSQENDVDMELGSYLLTRNIDSEDDPLVWWNENKGQYPKLSLLARKYLCITATSSPSERVFSTGGNIVTCLRSSLKPENVDRLVFLAKNL
ncbi:E3 SUMO-protein ligase ZBED1-like [Garra rufa]|uniref:E3 SUMO-protein ligase ZBED1-like n=1 Tax=Garra rufa TaxID=137080 RepID=UPI003CCEAC5E